LFLTICIDQNPAYAGKTISELKRTVLGFYRQ
jgi:hypothetical protein